MSTYCGKELIAQRSGELSQYFIFGNGTLLLINLLNWSSGKKLTGISYKFKDNTDLHLKRKREKPCSTLAISA